MECECGDEVNDAMKSDNVEGSKGIPVVIIKGMFNHDFHVYVAHRPHLLSGVRGVVPRGQGGHYRRDRVHREIPSKALYSVRCVLSEDNAKVTHSPTSLS